MIRLGLAAIAVLALGSAASAQTNTGAPTNIVLPNGEHVAAPPEARDFSKIEIIADDLGNRTYLFRFDGEEGSNVVAVVGDDGVVLIDTKFAQLHDRLKAAIAAKSKAPVRYIVSTVNRNDHTHGNAPFVAEGAVVIGHANMNKDMLLANPKTDKASMATKTFDDAMSLPLAGRTPLELHHPKMPALSDCDVYVYLRDANILVTGDLFFPKLGFTYFGSAPISSLGGGIDGHIAAMNELIAIANDRTKIVPGHGRATDKAAMIAYRDMLVTARTRMLALIKEGKSADDIVAAKPFADFQTEWKVKNERSDDVAAAAFIRAVYNQLKPTALR